MRAFGKTLGLLFASLALASCGGGGSGSAFTPPQSGTITLSATTTTLPVNVWGYTPTQYGNPTQAEVTITWRNADGSLVTGKDIAVSISPVNVAALSCLVDGDACKDGNVLFGSIPIKGINGQATIFVNATETAGTANFTVSAVDPSTGRTVSASLAFKVTSGVGPTPASVTLAPSPSAVYLPSSGGISVSSISATVRDGAGQLVPDPATGNGGFDNLLVEIVGDAGGAKLSSNSVSGPVSGTSVTSNTVHGVAIVSFQAADTTPQGPVHIRATADRADNNVSNGIQDPVTTNTSVVVSDGKLFSLVLTSPTTNDITVNPVSANVTSDSGASMPPDPDGSYSLAVSAVAVDRQGRPVAPGTVIEFGVIDSPMAGFPGNGAGAFLIAGLDGDPQESGTLFTAPGGHFRTAGGGAGPGDTLLVFGTAVEGNRDLESARTVQAINGETSLNVTQRFNPNDDTGATVNYGAKLPYVIGRATEGNIGASGRTDANGVARTTLNYPVSRLGKGALIWARGAGAPVNGVPRLVTTISRGGFAGVAPGRLVVNQTPLPGNTTVAVEVCLYDALDAPIQGAGIGFGFSNLGLGTGSIDNVATAGTLAAPTGAGGCTTGTLRTSGLGGGGGADAPTVTFTAGPRTPALPVPLAVDGDLLLQASPSSVSAGGGSVALLLTDASGNPIVGAQLAGTCTGGAGLGGLLGKTDANGRASATVTTGGIAPVCPGTDPNTGSCTFTTGIQGGPSVTVAVTGGFKSSTDPSCATDGGTPPPAQVPLNLVVVRGAAAPATVAVAVASSPSGLSCTMAAGQANNVCGPQNFQQGSPVVLNATLTPAGGATLSWSGDCTAIGPTSARVSMSGTMTCTVTVN